MKSIVGAFAGGIAGSFAMDLVQEGFAAGFERSRAAEDLDEEVEAIANVVRAFARIVPAAGSKSVAAPAGHALHYLFGCGFALAYAELRERYPQIAAGRGAAFGIALFITSDRILIPALKLGRPWARYSRSERANAFASHLAYAMVVEAFVRAAR